MTTWMMNNMIKIGCESTDVTCLNSFEILFIKRTHTIFEQMYLLTMQIWGIKGADLQI